MMAFDKRQCITSMIIARERTRGPKGFLASAEKDAGKRAMGIRMERPPGEMTLAALADRCMQEMGKFRRKEPSDDRYCLEILRRASVLHDEDAWGVLLQQFSSSIRRFIRLYSGKETALRYHSEEDYIAMSFTRFWQTVNRYEQVFTSVGGALEYLRACTRSTIVEALRTYVRPNVEPLPDYGHPDEPLFEDHYNKDELWEVLLTLLTSEKEIQVAQLHFSCNLKAREIMHFCPGLFSGEDEIYRLKRNIMEKVIRNRDKLRWKLGGDEYK